MFPTLGGDKFVKAIARDAVCDDRRAWALFEHDFRQERDEFVAVDFFAARIDDGASIGLISSSEHSARLRIPTIANASEPSKVVRMDIVLSSTCSRGTLVGHPAIADCMNQTQPNAFTIEIHQPR